MTCSLAYLTSIFSTLLSGSCHNRIKIQTSCNHHLICFYWYMIVLFLHTCLHCSNNFPCGKKIWDGSLNQNLCISMLAKGWITWGPKSQVTLMLASPNMDAKLLLPAYGSTQPPCKQKVMHPCKNATVNL